MTSGIADYVNESPVFLGFSISSQNFCLEDNANPIDHFYASLQEILLMGSGQRLSSEPMIGRLLLVALVSATENYFRSVLSNVMRVCPVAQSVAAEKTINLGGLLWHGRDDYTRSAFEHASFADQKAIRTTSRDFIGIELPDSEFRDVLKEFEKICELRHGIVHANGFLPGRNAVKLQVPPSGKPLRIVVDFQFLQQAADVAIALVGTYNRFLFLALCRRWSVDWRRRPDWTPSEGDRLFEKIWSICHSRIAKSRRRKKRDITMKKCRDAVMAQYNLY